MAADNRLARWLREHRLLGAVVFCGLVSVPVGLLILAAPGGGPVAALATFIACWIVGAVVMVTIDSRVAAKDPARRSSTG